LHDISNFFNQKISKQNHLQKLYLFKLLKHNLWSLQNLQKLYM